MIVLPSTGEVLNTSVTSHSGHRISCVQSIRGAFLCCALIVACHAAWSDTRANPAIEGRRHQDKTAQLGTQNSPLFVSGEVIAIKDRADAAQEAEERKVKEQTDGKLVEYTSYLAFCTFLLFVFTAALWWVTFRLSQRAQLEGDRQAAEMAQSIAEAVRSADAMEAVAEATKTNALLMKDIVQKQARAYLGFEGAVCVPQDRTTNWRYELRFHIKNFGHTSAQSVNVNSRLAILPFPIPQTFDCHLDIKDKPGADFATQQTYYFAASLDKLVSDEEINSFTKSGDTALCLYGVVKYRDVYGDAHYTNFFKICRWDVTGNLSTMNAPWHNDTT